MKNLKQSDFVLSAAKKKKQKMENMISYVIIFAILLVAELLYFRIADKYDIIDKPNLRSSHTQITLLEKDGIQSNTGLW